MSRILLFAAFGALTLYSTAQITPVQADETGLATLHQWKHEKGRRLCMRDHFHDGNGTGKTRKIAEDAAKRSWMEFTVFEYGRDWGSYKRSASKTMDCRQSTVSAKSWTCSTSARPCKAYTKPGSSRKTASR